MTDTLDDLETKIIGRPIHVDRSSTVELATMVLRYAGTAGTFFVALVGFLKAHDLAGLFNFLQTESVLPALSAIAALGFLGWGAVRTVLNKKRLVTVALAAPDAVAIVSPAPSEPKP